MTHTPGPWSCDYGDLSVYCETGAEVCEVTPGNNDDGTAISVAEMQDNTRLIAAAPELLSACRQAVSAITYLLSNDDDDPGYADTLNTLAAAIAKAEGRG